MQTYDVLMLVVLIGATVFGFWKGMAWQIASLASLFVSFFASMKFAGQLAPTFGDQAPLNKFVAMAVIYVVTSFVIWMLFRLVAGAIDKVRLESFDKQLGAMFGFGKGVLLCMIITVFAVCFLPPEQGEAVVASQSGRYIVQLIDKSHSVFPPELHQVVDPYLQKFEERRNINYHPQAGVVDGPRQVQATQPVPQGQAGGQWPPTYGTQPAQQQQWPPMPASQSQPQSQPQPQGYDPYSSPREPQPFPYSASRDY